MPRVLITGASVAGTAAAWWLGKHGHNVVVVERAASFRTGGQNIDVRGAGREVLRRMGLEEAALACGTGEEGTAWVNARGRAVAEVRADQTKADGPTAEMEILRGDLARILYDPARKQADFRFGERVASLQQDEDGVAVGFAAGAEERFDAVVIAEGVGSSTRELVFPGENEPRWMDLTIGYLTIPRVAADDQMWRWYHASGGRSISLRPDNHGTTRAMLSVRKPAEGEEGWDEGRQRAFLRSRFADAGWEAPRILAALEATDDLYFDVLRQVRMPRWSRGRVALLGDAAWCVTPMAGLGASLAIAGAYVLASELGRAEADVAQGFGAYEHVMRPLVGQAQDVPKFGTRLMNPQTRAGVSAMHGALRVATSPPIREVAARLLGREEALTDLPVY